MLVVDRSGSMDDNPDGPGGYASRLQLAVASLKNLIDGYTASTSGTVQVKIVQFADSAGYLAGSDDSFVDAATAKRSEEHTSELQSLMRISYAVFCLKKKKTP